MFHHLGLKPVDNFYIMAIALLGIYIAWILVFNQEASAPPIIVNTTKTRKELGSSLLKQQNPNGKGITDVTGLASRDFPKTDSPGKSGLAHAGLGQPCIPESKDTVDPNLPVSYMNQSCDKTKGLECIFGIYQGGGICLKTINNACDIKTDCSPEANFCINKLCQPRDEVINKSCKKDQDCKGALNDFNHVCDPVTKRCVYDIWPKDSGCTHKSQCKNYSAYPNSVICLTEGPGGKGAVVTITGTYTKDGLIVSSDNLSVFNQLKDSIVDTYVIVIDNSDSSYQGRIKIISISDPNLIVLDKNSFQTAQAGKKYTLEFGTEKDGICLVNYPLGTEPSTIEGSKTVLNKCQSGLKLYTSPSGTSYCVESNRTNPSKPNGPLIQQGQIEQVCTANGDLTCDKGLICTFDNKLVNSYASFPNNYHLDSGGRTISGQNVKDIGKCKKQEKQLYENCRDNCIKPYICLNETDINNKNFDYCGHEWDIMNDVSKLTGCPVPGLNFPKGNDFFCKGVTNNLCYSNNDCLSGKCGIVSNAHSKNYISYNFSKYNPETNQFIQANPNSNGPNIEEIYNPVQLASNTFSSTGSSVPSFLGYYYNTDENKKNWKIEYTIDGKTLNPPKTITVNFTDTPVSGPYFSVFKEGNVHQLNIGYVTEYQNSRRRTFENAKDYNFLHSAMTEGASVYFSGGTSLYNISFDSPNIDTSTANTMKIINLKSAGSVFPIPGGNMTTYSNKFGANTQTEPSVFGYFPVENNENCLKSGDFFTYHKGSGSNNKIEYLTNTPGTYEELQNGTCYYSVNFDKEPMNQGSLRKILYFTENYETINSNLEIKGAPLTKFGISVFTDNSNFNKDNSFMQMKPMYGYHFLPIDISPASSNLTVNIKPIKDYIVKEDNSEATFNLPVGYLSDTKEITAEITKESVIMTYDYGPNLNQVLSLDYSVTNTSSTFNRVDFETNGTEGTCYIYYNINNSFTLPKLKVPSGTSYSLSKSPYLIDQVRYFENDTISDQEKNTVSFLSTYKNIEPNNNRTSIGNVNTLRKLQFETDLNTSSYAFYPVYKGLDPQIETSVSNQGQNPVGGDISFGAAFFVTLSPIKESVNTSDTKGNIFLGGTDSIIFRVQEDIDVILKYGASDLVIGYNNFENAVAIVGIKEYSIDNDGNEILEVQTSFYLTPADNLHTEPSPRLYTNNIYPINIKPFGNDNEEIVISDGRNLVSSCIKSGQEPTFQTSKSNYNKILYAISVTNTPHTIYSFFDYRQLTQAYSNGDYVNFGTSETFLVNKNSLNTIVTNFDNSNYGISVTAYRNTNDPGYFSRADGNVYVTNNQFLSTTTPVSPVIYLNNKKFYSNHSVMGKYMDGSVEKSRSFGGVYMKNNTFPFYTGGLGKNSGLLDETYLKEIKWPYWIKNLNTGSIEIEKIFLNWNPGNMENNMFYYCFAKVNNVPMLLYISTNFTVNDIKESQAVPVVIQNFENMIPNLRMLPQDRNILLFSKTCQ